MDTTLLNRYVTAKDVRGHVVNGFVINLSNNGRFAFIRSVLHPRPDYYLAPVEKCQLDALAPQGETHV